MNADFEQPIFFLIDVDAKRPRVNVMRFPKTEAKLAQHRSRKPFMQNNCIICASSVKHVCGGSGYATFWKVYAPNIGIKTHIEVGKGKEGQKGYAHH